MSAKSDRLRAARLAAGFKSTLAAAERLGVSPSTYRAHENGQNEYDEAQAERYARAFHVTPAHLIFGDSAGIASGADVEGFEPQAMGRLPVRGEVAAGLWLETAPFLDDLDVTDFIDGLYVPPSMVQWTYCLRVRGTSINKIAPDGSYLVCLDVLSGIEVQERDVVIVERVRDDGSLREVTAKRLIRQDGNLALMPESDDPMWQNVIKIDSDPYQMDAEIRIVAKVKHVIRPVI